MVEEGGLPRTTVQIVGVRRGAGDHTLREAIRSAVGASMDLSRIQTGDEVLIVPALNSDEPYPATAHPVAVDTVAEIVKEHGGVPVVACLAGIEFVLQSPRGTSKGTSERCAWKSGMTKPSGVRFRGCEELGWEEGFTRFEHPRAIHWPNGMFITRLVSEAKHVIVVPRISAHSMAGVTLGLKCLVGLLRDDSRVDFHHPGPLSWFIRVMAAGSGLEARLNARPDFYAMIAEVGLCVHPKLLGSVLVGTKLQTTIGPNSHLLRFGPLRLFRSHVDEPDPGLVIASSDIVAADAVGYAFLVHRYRESPLYRRLWQGVLVRVNGDIKELGTEHVYEDRVMRRALEVGLGRKVDHVLTEGVPPDMKRAIEQAVLP